MAESTQKSIEITRGQLWLALVFSAVSLITALVIAALTFTLSPFFLLTPIPAGLLFVAVFAGYMREAVVTHAEQPAISVTAIKSSVEMLVVPERIPDRPVTVDEDREIYGIYATLQTLSASLNLSDTLTLVADRLERLIPDVTIVVTLSATDSDTLRNSGAFGRRAASFPNREEVAAHQPAAVAMKHQGTVLDTVSIDGPKAGAKSVLPAVAVPLLNEGIVFGALTLVRDEHSVFSDAEVGQLESIALFAASGIHNALIQQRSHHTALTDPFMLLPNNRAAFNILDQRIAESLRRRDGEPVGVICISLSDSDDQSSQDDELKNLCSVIGGQLRQMDIVTRGERNELLIVLPRAALPEANLVAERIRRAIDSQTGRSARLGQIEMGIAAFPQDGETSHEILTLARTKARADTLTTLSGMFSNVVTLDQWR